MSVKTNNPSEEFVGILEWFDDSFEKADKFFDEYQDKKSKKKFQKLHDKVKEYATQITITQTLSISKIEEKEDAEDNANDVEGA